MDRLRRIATALAVVTAAGVVAAGCGGDKTDIGEAIDQRNEAFQSQGIPVKLECPDQVDGHKGAEFDCELVASRGGQKEKVRMEIDEEGDELTVDFKDTAEFERTAAKLAAAQQPQGPQQGQQPPAQGGGGGGGGGQQPGQGGGQQQPGQGE
jgi:hypothetical protein